jgi:hypothetical protein
MARKEQDMICPNCGHGDDRHKEGYGCKRPGCPCVWVLHPGNEDMWRSD